MTRHSKNCTASSVYSYHEKKKDAKASGYGSLNMRYGKDGVKDFDCCSLSLHPCRDPVVTPDGYLFDKESILEYIITKKNEVSRKMKEYEKQCKKERNELAELGEAEQRSQVEKFLNTEAAVASPSQAAQGEKSKVEKITGPSVSNMVAGRDKKLPSFWVPSLTPGNKETKLKKPDKTVYCPISGKQLKAKDLIPVKFTLADASSSSSLEGQRDRYKCPVTGDVLRNNIPCAVLKPTGDVVTMECVKLIQKDMIHPLTGVPLKESDIIELQKGGTGFAAANDHLTGIKARPVLQA
ncbi:nitric oxide synthase-interacting protein homolog [Palaemon carinicauda]|uniref:nitric oxide synthase-interacting protein homolog n=1 Tax=Palaemon carinicauda TaxID=392227 RepID=UPI0035B68E5E